METKEIKTNESSGFYFGQVKMTLKKGDQKYKTIIQHNNGTGDFFKYILNCIRGENMTSQRPGYVNLIYEKEGSTKDNPQYIESRYSTLYESTGNIIVQEKTEGEPTYPRASMIYRFLIPEMTIETGDIAGARLLSVNNKNQLEYARVIFDDPVNVDVNTNIEFE